MSKHLRKSPNITSLKLLITLLSSARRLSVGHTIPGTTTLETATPETATVGQLPLGQLSLG